MPSGARLYALCRLLQGLCDKPRLAARLAASGALSATCRHILRLGLSDSVAQEQVGGRFSCGGLPSAAAQC